MKRTIFLLVMAWFAAGCAAPQEKLATPPTFTATFVPTVPTPLALTSTPQKSFVPKQNDLIFIEFFAVT